MALINLDIIPGIDKQNTTKGAERRWIDSDNVRFDMGYQKKLVVGPLLLTKVFMVVRKTPF